MKAEVVAEKESISREIIHAIETLAAISEEMNAAFEAMTTQSEQMVTHTKNAHELSTLAKEQATQGKNQLQQYVMTMENITTAVAQIAQSMLRTQKQNHLIEHEMTRIGHIISELGIAFDVVTYSADTLSVMAQELS